MITVTFDYKQTHTNEHIYINGHGNNRDQNVRDYVEHYLVDCSLVTWHSYEAFHNIRTCSGQDGLRMYKQNSSTVLHQHQSPRNSLLADVMGAAVHEMVPFEEAEVEALQIKSNLC